MGIDAQMFVRTTARPTPEKLLELSYRLAEAFGPDRFLIDGPDSPEPQHCLVIVGEYYQDGPTLYPEPGEVFIEVLLNVRYYGRGYERGPLPFIVGVAAWLEWNIPGAEVWYGGDCSGVLARPFGKQERAELSRHFYEVGHLPYSRPRYGDSVPAPNCPLCRTEMFAFHFRGELYRGFYCAGCEYRCETDDGGKTFEPL